jgi:lactate 2-monooxygenase
VTLCTSRNYKQQTGKVNDNDVPTAAMRWENTVFSHDANRWKDLAFHKEHWTGLIVLKGIRTIEDTNLAVEHGMDGIIIDNHGGRQYDSAVGSLDMLLEIVDPTSDKLTVLFGSGIRTGADIMKAIALGAKACLIGRPVIYGLAADGEAGAKHILKSILADLDMNLSLVRLENLRDLKRNVL